MALDTPALMKYAHTCLDNTRQITAFILLINYYYFRTSIEWHEHLSHIGWVNFHIGWDKSNLPTVGWDRCTQYEGEVVAIKIGVIQCRVLE